MNYLGIILNETHKGLLMMWRYRFSLLAQLALFALIFISICFFIGGGKLKPDILAHTGIGFITTIFAQIALRDMSSALVSEAQTGTLEQLYLCPAPMEFVLLGRVCATFVCSVLMVTILGIALVSYLDIPIHFTWGSVGVIGMITAGVLGFGFILGGATLLFKQVGVLGTIIQNALLFLNGSLFPVDAFPPWLRTVARSLPTTAGIDALRKTSIDQQTLGAILADQATLSLIKNSCLYLVIGIIVFKWCERKAKDRGSLGQY
jgi:ABC-2 type transport system permease protein